MKSFSEILKIASVFAGAVLGAGFAGGRELVTFFVSYGKVGFISALIAGFLFIFLGSSILYKSHNHSNGIYAEYLLNIFPKNGAYLINAFSEFFLISCFVIMLSGSGALFKEQLSLPTFAGSLITALISFIVLSYGTKGLSIVCSVLTPIMIAGIIFVDLCALSLKTTPASSFFFSFKDDPLFSAILYVSYNMLSCAPVLVSAGTIAHNKRNALLGGVLGGIALCTALILSFSALFFADSKTLLAELPMLVIAGNLNSYLKIVYPVVLYMAILTTAFSCGLPVINKLEKFSLSAPKASLLLCTASLPLSLLKFSVLVEYCYTFFGYLGLLLICGIILKLFKK